MSVTPFPPRERMRFVDDLLGYMTLAEKLGQLSLDRSAGDPAIEPAITSGQVGGIVGTANARRLQGLAVEHSRLGIPLLIAEDLDSRQSPWALAASWDESVAFSAGRAEGYAARERGANMLVGPRLALTAGADGVAGAGLAGSEPHLLARLGAAFADGAATAPAEVCAALSVSPGVLPDAAAACAAELARDPAVIGLDIEAGVASASLRPQFPGVLLAECRRITALLGEVLRTTTSPDLLAAAERAIAAERLTMAEIDQAVRGVLSTKHRLKLFRRPYASHVVGALPGDDMPGFDEVARRSMVLLRNEGGLLPLSAVSDRVLVVGSLDGAGAVCAEALQRSGVSFMAAPGLAMRQDGDSWELPGTQDRLALALTRDAAERADFALLVLESRHFRRRDQDSWALPTPVTMTMVQALARTSARLVALVTTAEPVDLGEADRHFAAVLQCWEPTRGFEEALSAILSGRASPEGRMPVTVGHFPFGHGLGLGECVVSEYRLQPGEDHVLASARVRNAGAFPMTETIQVYARNADDELRLAAFERVELAPETEATVRFRLGAAALGTIGASGRYEVAAGPREVLLGKNMARLLHSEISLTPAHARAIATGLPIALKTTG